MIVRCAHVRHLQIIFSLRKGAPDVMGMISLGISWAQFGSSMGKVVLLKDLLPYRRKQVELHAALHTLQVQQIENKKQGKKGAGA